VHDPAKPKGDITFLAGYATRHGLDPVNEQLRTNFGVGLEDVEHQVTVVAGPSTMKSTLAHVKVGCLRFSFVEVQTFSFNIFCGNL
jgi:hypothetical protein